MQLTREQRLEQAVGLSHATAITLCRQIQAEVAASENANEAFVAVEVCKRWAKQYEATIEILRQTHMAKPSKKARLEAIVAVRELAVTAIHLAAASLSVVVQCRVEIPALDVPQQPI